MATSSDLQAAPTAIVMSARTTCMRATAARLRPLPPDSRGMSCRQMLVLVPMPLSRKKSPDMYSK